MQEKLKTVLEFTTPHKTQLNVIIERIFSFIKEGTLDVLLNENLDDTSQKIMWTEAVQT